MRKWAKKKMRAKIAGRTAGIPAAASAPAAAGDEGKRFRYTADQLDFLRAGFAAMQVPALTAAFNERFGLGQTPGQVKSTLKNHKITCGRKPGNPKGSFRLFTPEQAEFIRERYARFTAAELTPALNRHFGTDFSLQQLKSFVHNHGINSGRTGRFEPGQQSWNKGVRGHMGANRTSFRRGRMPHTKRRLWSERINRDGFIEISVPEPNPWTGAPTRFKHKHVWLWEVKNGPVPKGHAVVFVDGNKLNCTIENLLLVTRAELLSLNLHGYRETPDELKPAVLAMAKVEARAGFRIRPARGRRMEEATHAHY